jgi:hypothetical protein
MKRRGYDLQKGWEIQRASAPIWLPAYLRWDAEVWGRQRELELERGELPVDPRSKLKGVKFSDLIERYRDNVSIQK